MEARFPSHISLLVLAVMYQFVSFYYRNRRSCLSAVFRHPGAETRDQREHWFWLGASPEQNPYCLQVLDKAPRSGRVVVVTALEVV